MHAIACIDACFQHVRCKNAGGADASVQLPQSIFLSSWAVQEAEAHVEECRGRRPSQQKADVVQALSLRAHDSVESGLQVPASVLFVNTVPNITGFSETITAHIKLHSYTLHLL